MTQGHYQLYGTEFSLYSGKARAYLRYKGIPFREKLATLNQYRKVILPRTGVAMIPVLETPEGTFIQDTTEIIDTLEPRFPERGVYPATPKQHLVALLLELYGDEWLLIPAMHYRWNFPRENERFLMGEFGKIVAPWLPGPLRRMAGRRLASRFSGMLPMLGITPETRAAIEAGYERFLDQLNTHFEQYPYLLGHRASMADFGFMGPLYAHLGRDPAPARLMRERAPAVAAWVTRMNTPHPPVGEWLEDDTIPQTLYPILRDQFETQFPVLRDTINAVAEWIAQHPGERLPRMVGEHNFRLGNVEARRALLSFPQWMAQRPLFYYQGLDPESRTEVDALLEQTGGLEAMQLPICQPVKRENNRLVPA